MNVLQMQEFEEVTEFIDGIEESQQTFEITDLSSLTWAFRKLKVLKDKEKDIKNTADAERERIVEWERKELSTITSNLQFFESLVSEYHVKQLVEDPKAKTLTTPYGKSKSRKSKEQPEKENEDVVLQYVIENELDEFIKNSVKWAELKKSLRIAEISGEKVVVDQQGQIVRHQC